MLSPFVVGCTDALHGSSTDARPAASRLDQLAVALAARFTNIDRSGRFETARRRLVAHALTPSKIFDDSAVWSTTPSTERHLAAIGSLEGNGYRFTVVPRQRLASGEFALGDTRHDIWLRLLAGDQYRWETTVDFAMGSMPPGDFVSTVHSMLVAPEGRTASELRSAARAAFPKTTTAFSRLLSVDSFQVTRTAPSATAPSTVYLRARMSSENLRAAYPHFSAYVDRYVKKSRYRFRLTDRSGATFMELAGEHDTLAVRYRVAGGELVSLAGPPRPFPDTLKLRSDLLMRGRVFDLGFHDLIADVVVDRSARARTWTVIGRQEPRWDLPLVTERLIRAPLQRPFKGTGARFQLSFRETPGGMTLLTRHAELEVQESAIMRFIGGFIAGMLDDHDAAVEREQAAFLREAFLAMQADARALARP